MRHHHYALAAVLLGAAAVCMLAIVFVDRHPRLPTVLGVVGALLFTCGMFTAAL